jgi:precorrin-2 dehydrogenase / sirohydrochlorin ferrochelatase
LTVAVEAGVYPINLVVDGRRCLVVGGGVVAARKVRSLVECGAVVHVVAPEVSPAVRETGATWEERPYRDGEVAGYRLAIAATDEPAVNQAVFRDGEAAGVWVNSADDPAHCSFTLPSVLRRGPLVVAVSTGGHSPAVAAWLRRRLEQEIGPEYEVLLDVAAEAREELRAAGRSPEAYDWQSALDSGMLELVREGRLAEARERLKACLSSSSA